MDNSRIGKGMLLVKRRKNDGGTGRGSFLKTRRMNSKPVQVVTDRHSKGIQGGSTIEKSQRERPAAPRNRQRPTLEERI